MAPLIAGVEHRFMVGGTIPGYASYEDAVARLPATRIADETAGADMLYSSGTTGRPKGVLPVVEPQPIDADNPLLPITRTLYGMDADSIYLSPAPLYHAAPLRFNMSGHAARRHRGDHGALRRRGFLRLVEPSTRRRTRQLVPTMFVRMLKLPDEVRLKYDVSSLNCAIHAAAPCPIQVKQKMIEWWGPIIYEYYAGTEGNGLTMCNSADWLAHPGTVGRAVVGQLTSATRTATSCRPARRARSISPAAASSRITTIPKKTAESRNAHGWSTLGDVGKLDAEGYLYLTDRKAFMIISGGVNIYPQEAENLLITHPKVADCAVIGVPNEDFGEEVKAVVQPLDMADASPAARRGADRLLPPAAFRRQVPAHDRFRAGAAAPSDRQALQAPDPRPLLAGPRQQDRLRSSRQ